jgi:hypothetical protein
MASDKFKDDLTFTDPAWQAFHQRIEFWRTAARSNFDEIFWSVQDKPATKEDAESNFLVKAKYEDLKFYNSRAKTVVDSGFSEHVLKAFLHFWAIVEKKVELVGGAEDIKERFEENIDLKQTDISKFMDQLAEEFLVTNKVFVFVDSEPKTEDNPNPLPYAFIIPPERIMDLGKDEFNNVKYIKWWNPRTIIDGFRKKLVKEIIVFTEETIIKALVIEGEIKDENIQQIDNEIGKVPIIIESLTESPNPIINTPARFQHLMMNMKSWLESMLQLKSIAPLAIPKSSLDQMGQLDVGSAIPLADKNATMPKFIETEGMAVDQYLNYFQFIQTSMKETSHLRFEKNTAAPESEKSKHISFTDTAAVLRLLRENVIIVLEKIVDLFSEYTGQTGLELEVSISKKFDIKGLNERLEEANNILRLGIGKTATNKLRRDLRNQAVDLIEDDLEKSDSEIDALGENVFTLQDFQEPL